MIEYLEQYFRSQQLGSAAETTLQSKRSRLGQFLRHYEEIHGTSAIVSRITDVADQPEEIQREEAVYKGQRTYYLEPTASELDFSLLMAGDMLSPFIGEEEVDAQADAFSQWLMNLAYEEE
jgi:hypothetical protein